MARRIDYQRKKLNNPFFSKKDGQTALKKKKRLVFVGVLLAVVLSAYFFDTLKYFKITSVTVKGVEFINDQEIKNLIADQLDERRWLLFHQSNIFFFNKKQAEERIQQTYLLNDFKIKKKYFNQIEVDLQRNNSGVIWANANNQYYLDLEGRATKLIDPQSLVMNTESGSNVIRSGVNASQYPLIKDLSNREVNVGESILSPETVAFILELTSRLRTEADFEIAHYEINRPAAQDITLVTQEGWLVKFSLQNSVTSQINSLAIVLKQRANDRSKLDYIDLRFGEKVFWK
ncbi:MAG: FtsQ-type POTRA domain-containing protein [Candidatus Buchananbacteria bacterium]|nr:FtsQ-type POTRA domain-containing protein [Candidatus Buchananbacteria bacterium]